MNDADDALGAQRRSTLGPETGAAATQQNISNENVKAYPTWWARMLDGRYVWGSLHIWPPRHGVHRYRLVVYPPGIDATERRQLRLWRAWRGAGAVLWLTLQLVLSFVLTPGWAIFISTALFASTGAVAFVLTARLRPRVRTLALIVMDGHHDERTAVVLAELEAMVGMLGDAQMKLESGQLSAIGHEAAWWQVYDRMRPYSN